MDFIDDFIEAYKCNPCLWKADSLDFRNRNKRQEAYMKLIEVATKHGEHYNVERTKQKINNLRCAFRHQLRKYNEVKNKGEKYEPYCPKRRYFESLMFLKDEEIPDKKLARQATSRDNSIRQRRLTNSSAAIVPIQTENFEEFSDAESLPKQLNQNDSNKLSPKRVATEYGSNIFEETEVGVDSIISMQPVNTNTSSGPTIKEVEIVLPPDNIIVSDRRKSTQDPICVTSKSKSTIRTVESDRDKTIGGSHHKYIKSSRKRSSSTSSQVSDDDAPIVKCLKADISNSDFERLLSLALRSADNHLDDHFTNYGKIIAHKLRTMESTQAIYAEKIIADVLYQGQMKMLSTLSIHQFVGVDNTTVYVESHSK